MFVASSFDINNHISWAQDAVSRGLPGFYETQSKEVYAWLYPNYPPLAILIFCLVFLLKQQVFNLLWWLNLKIPLFPSKIFSFLGTRQYTTGFYKIPAIIFDLILAYLVYLLAKKLFPKNERKHLIIVSLILFNPMFFYISGLWGQIETIVLTFFLISLYLLLFSKKPVLSFVFFVLSFLVKPVVIIFLPIYIIYFLKNYRWKEIINSLIIGNLIFWLSFLPFYKSGNIFTYPYTTYFNKIILSQSLDKVSNSAFNFWSIFSGLMQIKDTTKIVGPVSYQRLGFIIVAVLYAVIISKYLKQTKSLTTFFYALFLTGFVYLMFATKMHERYFIYLLPFLFLVSLKEEKYFKWSLFLSILFFLNVFYSWSIPYFDWMALFKNNLTITCLSLINFLSFGYLLFKIDGRLFIKPKPFS
jgi:Gpi18-like mannosyltransferase